MYDWIKISRTIGKGARKISEITGLHPYKTCMYWCYFKRSFIRVQKKNQNHITGNHQYQHK